MSTLTPQTRAIILLAGFEPTYELEVKVPKSTFSIDLFWPSKAKRSTLLGPLRAPLERRVVVVEYASAPPSKAALASACAKLTILTYDHHMRRPVGTSSVRPPALLVLSHGRPRAALGARGAEMLEPWLWHWNALGPAPAYLVDMKRLPQPGHPAFQAWQPFGLLAARTGGLERAEIEALLANPEVLSSDRDRMEEPMSRLSEVLSDKREGEGLTAYWQRLKAGEAEAQAQRAEAQAQRAEAQAQRAEAQARREAQIAMLAAVLEAQGKAVDADRLARFVDRASAEALADAVGRIARGEAVPELE